MDQHGYPIIDKQHVARAKRELTVIPIDRSGMQQFPKKIPVWWTYNDQMMVPRFWGQEKYGILEHIQEGKSIDITFAAQLREDLDQPLAMHHVMQSLHTTGGGLLCLGTGQGKTVCACYAMSQIRKKTLVLVHKDVLRLQWNERIQQFLPGATVSYVQGKNLDTSGDIVIGMLQTVIIPTKEIDWSEIGFVIVDEAHHIAAETFSTAMRNLNCRYCLGLTATPTRKDGLTNIIHWFLGPMAYAAQRDKMSHVIVDIVKYSCEDYKNPPPMTRFGTVNFPEVTTNLANDTTRTELIVEYVKKIRENPERIVLVLSHRRDHCIELASKIPDAVAFLGGKTSKKKKKDTSHETSPVVCATFALASEGYDDARLNTLVLATPCSDVTQAAGRILRGSSTLSPIIVDIQDEFSVAYAQSAKRKSYYAKAGFKYGPSIQKQYPSCIIID